MNVLEIFLMTVGLYFIIRKSVEQAVYSALKKYYSSKND